MLGHVRVFCAIVAIAALTATALAQAPDGDLRRLRADAEATRGFVNFTSEQSLRDHKARIDRAIAEIEARLRATSRESAPLAWGSLQTSLAIALHARVVSADYGGDVDEPEPPPEPAFSVPLRCRIPLACRAEDYAPRPSPTPPPPPPAADPIGPVLAAADAALSVLTRDNAPLDWARAQVLRASVLDPIVVGDDAVMSTSRAEGARARQAALTVYTRDAHPLQYLEIRCGQITQPFLDAPAGSAAEKRADVVLTALAPSCTMETFLGGERTGEKSPLADIGRQMLPVLAISQPAMEAQQRTWAGHDLDPEMRRLVMESQAATTALTSGAALTDMIDGARASFLSATLAMDRLGLAPAQLARARALRAKADQLAATTPHGVAWRANTEMWRAHAELVDILAAARPDDSAAPALDEPVIAVMMLDEDRGAAMSKPPSGVGAMALTEGLARSIAVAFYGEAFADQMLNPQTPGRRGRRAPITEAPPERSAEESMALMKQLSASNASANWMRMYAAGDIDAAVTDFRRRFEPRWSPVLREVVAKTGVAPGGRLVILPDGAASMLPIGLLRDARTGRALIEDYEIVFTPSIAVFDAAKRRAAQVRTPSLVVVAPPLAESGLNFVESEVALTRAWFPGAATRASGKAAVIASLRTASYWHFATHGAFDAANPRQSALQLSGGAMLTLSDLLFAEQSMGAPRLVVLSACETGLFDFSRDPDEFIGLPTGFLQAGAAGVIASLWPVSDAPTALLMAKLYERHVGAGERPSAALRQAQLWLKDADAAAIDGFVATAQARGALTPAQAAELNAAAAGGGQPFAAPRYWGAFVYYGA